MYLLYSVDLTVRASFIPGILANFTRVEGDHSVVLITCDPFRRVNLFALNTGHSLSRWMKVSSSSSQNLQSSDILGSILLVM